MANINNIVKRVIAVIKLPVSIPQLIAKAKNIVSMMTGNANFPTPYPSNTPALATVTADITALETAESLALTKAKGAASARDVKKGVVLKDLYALLRYVQGQADNIPASAEAIIQSAGFDVKKPGEHMKSDFEVRHGTVSGSVLLTAKSAGKRASYEWQMSTMQQSSSEKEISAAPQPVWINLPSTLVAKTSVAGLTPGTTMLFRFRAVLPTGESSWSQVVSIIII